MNENANNLNKEERYTIESVKKLEDNYHSSKRKAIKALRIQAILTATACIAFSILGLKNILFFLSIFVGDIAAFCTMCSNDSKTDLLEKELDWAYTELATPYSETIFVRKVETSKPKVRERTVKNVNKY